MTLRLPFSLLALACSTALSAATQDNEPTLDSVIVVGTSRTDQTASQSLAPVDVVTASQLKSSGHSDLSSALQAVLPSFNFTQNLGGYNGGLTASGGSLHGLKSDKTLILVNGKRLQNSPVIVTAPVVNRGTQTVDLSAIPVGAVERVEVLLDGASAQYGSDAIAGVINIILKERDQGGEINTGIGQYSKGDGLRRNLNGWTGFALPQDGFLTLSASALKADETSVGGTDSRQFYVSGQGDESQANRKWRIGSPELERFNAAANWETGLSEQLRTYGLLNFSRQQSTATSTTYVRPLSIPANLRSLYPDGFLPEVETTTDTFSSAIGLRHGDANDPLGLFDASLIYGQTDVDYYASRSLNTSYSAATAAQSLKGDLGDLRSQQQGVQFDYSKNIATGWFEHALSLASGVAYRHEEYRQRSGDEALYRYGGRTVVSNDGTLPYGVQGLSAYSAEDAGEVRRDSVGIYLNLEQQVSERWKLGLASRADDYSDFGSTYNSKASIRFDWLPSLSLRGTVGTGFRAPSLGQMGHSQTNGYLYLNDPTVVKLLPSSLAVAQALGASELKPEKSENLSLGLVWTPSDTLSASVDIYQTKIKDQIELTGNMVGATVAAITQNYGYSNLPGVQYFSNALDTTTRGVDFIGNYRWRLDGGDRLDLRLGFSWNDVEIDHVKDTPSQFAGTTIVPYGRQVLGLITDGAPKSKLVLGGSYQHGNWTGNLNVTRYGSYKSYGAEGQENRDQRFSAQWVSNASLGYELDSGWNALLGVDNLFDSRPDKLLAVTSASTGGVNQYSGLSPFGAEGRYVYLNLGYRF